MSRVRTEGKIVYTPILDPVQARPLSDGELQVATGTRKVEREIVERDCLITETWAFRGKESWLTSKEVFPHPGYGRVVERITLGFEEL